MIILILTILLIHIIRFKFDIDKTEKCILCTKLFYVDFFKYVKLTCVVFFYVNVIKVNTNLKNLRTKHILRLNGKYTKMQLNILKLKKLIEIYLNTLVKKYKNICTFYRRNIMKIKYCKNSL